MTFTRSMADLIAAVTVHTQRVELDLGAPVPTPVAGRAAVGVDADGALVTKTPAGTPSPVAFPKLLAYPSTPTDKAFGYVLDVLGVDQFFIKTEDGIVHQLTPPSGGGAMALTEIGVQTTTIATLTTATILSGPAAGFVRLAFFSEEGALAGTFGNLYATPSDSMSVSYKARLVGSFGTQQLSGDTETIFAAYSGASLRIYGVIGSGESITVENLDALHTIHARIAYVDIPDTGITLVRVSTNGITPVTLIPAPAAGKVHVAVTPGTVDLIAVSESHHSSNNDTVAHGFVIKVGTVPVYALPALGVTPGDMYRFTQPVLKPTESLTVELTEATATTESVFCMAYREIDLA